MGGAEGGMFLYIPAMEGEDELAFDFTPLSNLGRVGTLKYLPMEKSFPFLFPEENTGTLHMSSFR